MQFIKKKNFIIMSSFLMAPVFTYSVYCNVSLAVPYPSALFFLPVTIV